MFHNKCSFGPFNMVMIYSFNCVCIFSNFVISTTWMSMTRNKAEKEIVVIYFLICIAIFTV